MGKRDGEIYASCARSWRHEEKNGKVTSLIGTFSRDNRTAARGCADHLRRQGWVDKDFEPEKYSDAYVIRLTAKDGHNLEKYEKFLHKYKLLPALAARREKEEHAILLAELDQEQAHGHRFTPVKGAEAKKLIASLHWETVETASPTLSGPNGFIVAVIKNHEQAFRAGYYLHKKGYIDKDSFKRLNTEINHSLDIREKKPEFRIAIEQ
ncbi:MAG: hypothetical protein K2Q01_01020, partial [Rickettsiales bacterium]|nr:hypothetical protein [Rickettsiales bacterium]